MASELINILENIEKEKGIKKENLVEAIIAALEAAYKKNYNSNKDSVRVDFDLEDGEVKVFSLRKVVEEPENNSEISLEEAKKINPKYDLDDVIEREVTPSNFGRIAAQNARQVIIQRIKEQEREVLFNKYLNRETELVTGKIQRSSNGVHFISLGKVEGVLLPNEQIVGEDYYQGKRLKTVIKDVSQTTKGPQIVLSRTDENLVKRLFELEVPEIYDGEVEIRSISREAGSRTKIAVYSLDNNIDPVGACVGKNGSRVNNIVEELSGEKIDIIKWSSDPVEFISNALSPADVIDVIIMNEASNEARVIVPDDQLSLAIGKAGQNARLSAKLTGWKIDIKSESQRKETLENDEDIENNEDESEDEQM